MADERKFPEELQVFFEISKDFKTIACNGAWGGLTPRADMLIQFFIEKQAIPESIKNKVNADGSLGPIIETKPPNRIVRELQVGVLMSVDEARNLVKFLNDKIQQYETIKSEIDKRKS
jgi:hypothetical protein